ncbi:MAG: DUF4019 domain-containing protein [Stenotrophomonas sp.]
MMRVMLSVVFSTALLAAPLLAWGQGAAPRAQTPAPPTAAAVTAEQRQALARQDSQMAAAAAQVAVLIDGGRAGEVWDGASEVMRKAAARPAFIQAMGDDRQRLGAMRQRGEPSVTRVQYAAGGAVPPGVYLNVSFATLFANSAQPVRELVSFRLDEDRTWRVSGYSVRPVGQ